MRSFWERDILALRIQMKKVCHHGLKSSCPLKVWQCCCLYSDPSFWSSCSIVLQDHFAGRKPGRKPSFIFFYTWDPTWICRMFCLIWIHLAFVFQFGSTWHVFESTMDGYNYLAVWRVSISVFKVRLRALWLGAARTQRRLTNGLQKGTCFGTFWKYLKEVP